MARYEERTARRPDVRDAAGRALRLARAAGDPAAAASEALRSPLLRRGTAAVLVCALSLCFLCVLFLYALPTVIFEAVQTFFESVRDVYDEVLFSGRYGDATDSAGAALRITAGETVRRLWSAVFRAEDRAVPDAGTDAPDLYVTQSEAAETEALNEKLRAACEKLEQRAESLAAEILRGMRSRYEALAGDYTAPDGTLVSARVCLSTDASSAFSRSSALNLLALYTVQTGASITGIRLSDFQRWLGWDSGTMVPRSYAAADFTDGYLQLLRGGLERLRRVDVSLGTVRADGSAGDPVTVSVVPWQGTCLPQYAVDTARYEAALFGRPVTPAVTGCAAVDLYLVAEVPDPAGLPATVCEYVLPVTVPDPDAPDGTRTVWEKHRDIVYSAVVRVKPRTMAGMLRLLGIAGTYEED